MRAPSRSPTAEERANIRRLLRRAGGHADLLQWIEQALAEPTPRRGGRKRGADTYKIDARLLPALEHFCRIAAEHKGLTETAALRWLTGAIGADLMGADPVSRLRRKMKAGKFPKWKAPPGSRIEGDPPKRAPSNRKQTAVGDNCVAADIWNRHFLKFAFLAPATGLICPRQIGPKG